MREFYLMWLICVFSLSNGFAQVKNTDGSVLDPNDPVYSYGFGEKYSSSNPPTEPEFGYVGKWVRTKRLNWNTDSYKAYIYKGLLIRMKFPQNYDQNRAEKYPAIVMLHGLGENAADEYDNENQLKHGGQIHQQAIDNGSWDGFAIFPQHYGGWPSTELAKIKEFVDFIVKYKNVDANRINLHGLSMGGSGTWDFAIRNPKLFSSILPMSATISGYEIRGNKDIFKYTPIWMAQGGKDTNPPPSDTEYVVQQLEGVGSDLRYSLYEDLGHGVWNTMYNEADFFPFMTRANKTNPWPLFERTEFCEEDAIQVTLGLTPGFDGYQWRKNGVVISGATSNTYQVTEIGVYDARIKRGTEWSYWSPQPVEIKYKEATVTPPIALAEGNTQFLPAPSGNSTILELPEGFEQYIWKKAGEDAVIGSKRQLVVTEPGDYIASVKEKYGCSSTYADPYTVFSSHGVNAPDAILGVTGNALSRTTIRLDWNDHPKPSIDETGFEIYRSEKEAGPYQLIHLTLANVKTYQDEQLIPGVTYYYQIRPVNQETAGAASSVVSVTTQRDTNPPTAPANVIVTQTTDHSVSLNWEASTDDVGIKGYEVYRNGSKIIQVTDLEYTNYNLLAGQVYNFVVRAIDLAGNPSANSAQVTAATVQTGLKYAYYEGSWSALPDFSQLTPAETGMVTNFDLSPRNQDDDFAFVFDGFISVPQDGSYTFYTSSDDGSKLYINDQQVVNNDGLHGFLETSGSINLTQGSHKIKVTFFERTGGESLTVKWSGPGISKQQIPSEVLKETFEMPGAAPVAPANLTASAVSYNQIDLTWEDKSDNETGFQIFRSESMTGPFAVVATAKQNVTQLSDTTLSPETQYFYKIQTIGRYGESAFSSEDSPNLTYRYYKGVFRKVSDLEKATPAASGTVETFNLSMIDTQSNFGVIYEGNITLSEKGTYTFYTESDDGSKLWINGQEIVNNDYDQISWERNGSFTVNEPGRYAMKVAFRQRRGGYGLTVRYSGPGIAKQEIPATALKKLDANAITFPLPPAPNAPTGLAATAMSPNQIDLTWKDQSDNETSFEVYRSVGGNDNFILWATINSNQTDSIRFQDKSLLANTGFFYKVIVNGVGGSQETPIVSAITLNNLPVLDSIRDIVAVVGESSTYKVKATDLDFENLTFSTSTLPSFVRFVVEENGVANIISEPSLEDAGSYTLSVQVTDEHQGSDEMTFQLTVGTNHQPSIQAIEPLLVGEGEKHIFTLVADDVDTQDSLIWSATNLPDFVSLSGNNREASLIVEPGYLDAGLYEEINIEVQDSEGAKTSQQLTLEVTDTDPLRHIYVNFTGGTLASNPWNNVKKVSSQDLLDSEGNASGVRVEFQTSWWRTYTDGAVTGDNSGVYPDAVAKEYYYFGIFDGPSKVNLKIKGLLPGTKHTISFFASSNWTGASDNGSTVYTIGSVSKTLRVQNNIDQIVTIEDALANASGEILVTMTKAANTPVGYINAMVIHSTPDDGNPPAAPQNLAAITQDGQVSLTWKDTPYNEAGYQVYRADAEDSIYALTGELPANSNSFTDTDVESNQTYHYKVVSYNAHGSSEETALVSITTPALPSVWETIEPMVVEIDTTYTKEIQIANAPMEGVTLSAISLPSFVSLEDMGAGMGKLTIKAGSENIGEYQDIQVAAINSSGTSYTSFSIKVLPKKTYSVKVNFTKNAQVSGNWFNTSKAPAKGDVFSNLPKEDGTTSSIAIKLLTAWGGVYDMGGSTGNNSGIVPDAALKEYYYFGWNGGPEVVRIEISGLTPGNIYNLRFVASSVFNLGGVTDNGSTIYTLEGFASDTLYVQGNTDREAIISNYTADETGKAYITMTKAAGTPVGYINSLVIDAFEIPTLESDPEPATVSTYGTGESQVQVQWTNPAGAMSYELYRSTSKLDGFTKIYAGTQRTFADTGLSSGTLYYYMVKSIFQETSVESDVVAGATILSSVYMNMNGDRNYDQAGPWNNFGVLPLNGDIFGGFKNQKGNDTGMALKFEQSFTGDNDWGLVNGVYPDNVMKSFFFMENLETAKFVLQGLDQTMRYNFVFFSSINQNFSVRTDFTIGDQTVVTEASNNTSNTEVIRGIVPNEQGEIYLDITSTTRWSIFNAMVVEAYPSEEALNLRSNTSGTKPVAYNKTVYQISEASTLLNYLQVYPNQFEDHIQIKISEDYLGAVNVSLSDLNGRSLMNKSLSVVDLQSPVDVSGLNLKQGMYILTIRIDDEVRSYQMIRK